MKTSIVIPTYNKVKHLAECCASIKRNTDLTDVEVIVVSNGCKDGTKEYVNGLGDPFRLISWHKPLGYTRATNIGISASDADYVLLFNNDNVILDWGKNWLQILEAPFRQHSTAGLSGPHKEWRGGKPWLLFYCCLIKRDVFQKVGLLDETFSPGAGEDTDFGLKAQLAGYTVHQVPKELDGPKYDSAFPIYHKGSLTMLEIENHDEHYRRNELILQARYGVGSLTKP